jgi:hypothetical protein
MNNLYQKGKGLMHYLVNAPHVPEDGTAGAAIEESDGRR